MPVQADARGRRHRQGGAAWRLAHHPSRHHGFVILLWAALAVTTGSAARSHRAYVAEVEKRARQAEQAREDEANRRVAEERLRIARELHDAVGHHVALINVQAGALACLLDDEDLIQSRESVAHIQRASEEALEELRLTVGLLREPVRTSRRSQRSRCRDLTGSRS